MFTGLVEETGVVESIDNVRGDAVRLKLKAAVVTDGLSVGDSVAVNGCCLTVVAIEGGSLSFDLLAETVHRTSFAHVEPGSLVNLERSLAVGQRMGGHFVSGHIDCTGEVSSFAQEGDDWVLQVNVPSSFAKYLVYKGSVSIDGISLTVAGVEGDAFHVCLIPHTLEVTNLQQRKPGQRVNLEFDLLAKYVERIIEGRREG